MWLFKTPEGIVVFILCILAALTLFYFLSCVIVSYILFILQLKRTSKKKWARQVSKKQPIMIKMYNEGMDWREKNKEFKKDVHIVNDGLNLYGEYYDFGFDRAVFFIPGRTESLGYSFYFVQPYKELGFNVLTIDARAHGESDGVYNTVGFEEHKDVLAWSKFLYEECGMKNILLHGICIGSSAALMALTKKDCPNYVCGLIADGMYTTFYESFKNHMVSDYKQPEWPVMPLVTMWMKHYTGHNMKFGNIHIMDKLDKPLLMIHSKEDKYSLPSGAKILYEKCPHNNKMIVWFEHGAHSKLRVTDPNKYDSAIETFINKYFPKENKEKEKTSK